LGYSKETLQKEFEANKSQLRSYLFRLTANREDTQDLLQDTYIKASEKLASFENRSSLKTWIFAIATNLARDHFRSKKRWSDDAMDLAREESVRHPEIHLARFMDINQSSLQGAFEIGEHINFCLTCTGKTLPIEQQIALLLKEIFDYRISEIACILDVTEGVVKHLLHDARMSMQNIFEKRCSLINKKGVCHQCSELNGIFNPKQNFREQMIKQELDSDIAGKSNEHLFDIRTKIAKAVDPYESSGADLQFCHFDHVNNIQQSRQLP
jgi:RNA polymerase sigma-70 factor (ECF subfamily)